MNLPIWNYDPAQENMLIHAGECFADPDPEEPGKWLIPAKATTVPPLPDQEGETQHFSVEKQAWYFKNIPAPISTDVPPIVGDPKTVIQNQIDSLEYQQLLPRITREFMLEYLETTYTPEQLAQNIGYTKLKEFDDQIASLRTQIKALGA
jgi:hypothetical protein